jgi:lysyl-tRNA synthetase class II
MMNLVEEMVCTISEKLNGTLQLTYQGEKIDLTPPWRECRCSKPCSSTAASTSTARTRRVGRRS